MAELTDPFSLPEHAQRHVGQGLRKDPLSESIISRGDFGLLDLMDPYRAHKLKPHDASGMKSALPFVPKFTITFEEGMKLVEPGQTVIDYYRAKARTLISKYANAGYQLDQLDEENILSLSSRYICKSLTDLVWEAATINYAVTKLETSFQEKITPPSSKPEQPEVPLPQLSPPVIFNRLPENPDDMDFSSLDEQ